MSHRPSDGSPLERALADLRDHWARGDEPSLDGLWRRHDPDLSTSTLSGLVKEDLRHRFSLGEQVAVREYLDQFPDLGLDDERVISLVYEEFCLREERGERPDPDSFCDRYEPWRDSLASQLRYHRELSQVVGQTTKRPPRYPEPGERFLGFQLRSLLGKGGVSRVYLALEEGLGGREVALKITTDRGNESSILGRLEHPHIVPINSFTTEEETGLSGLCMPYRPGRSLDEAIRAIGPGKRRPTARDLLTAIGLDDEDAVQAAMARPGWAGFPVKGTYPMAIVWVVSKLAEALRYSHSRGILHRDVKPANVLLTHRDGPQLLDFNLAHAPHAPEQADFAMRGGTLPYMAPEQLRAFIDPARWDRVAEAADLYSLGLLMTEMLTGRRPETPDPSLPTPRAIQALLDQRGGPLPSPRSADSTIPHSLDAIASRCLARSVDDRYETAEELTVDLHAFLLRKPNRHAPNPSKPERIRNCCRRNFATIVCVALLAIGVPVAGAVISRFEKGRSSEARSYLQRGLAHEAAGEVREAQIDYDLATQQPNAREAFKRVFPKEIGSSLASAALGNLLNKEKDRVGAAAAFERAVELDPNSFGGHNGLGFLAYTARRFPLAFRHWSRALEALQAETGVNPLIKPDLMSNLGIALIQMGNQLAEEADRSKNRSAAYEEALSRYKEAQEDLKEARGSEHAFPTVWGSQVAQRLAMADLGIGDVYFRLSRLDEAAPWYKSALRHLEEARRINPRADKEGVDKMEKNLKLRLSKIPRSST